MLSTLNRALQKMWMAPMHLNRCSTSCVIGKCKWNRSEAPCTSTGPTKSRTLTTPSASKHSRQRAPHSSQVGYEMFPPLWKTVQWFHKPKGILTAWPSQHTPQQLPRTWNHGYTKTHTWTRIATFLIFLLTGSLWDVNEHTTVHPDRQNTFPDGKKWAHKPWKDRRALTTYH